jgi:hypothetical protein
VAQRGQDGARLFGLTLLCHYECTHAGRRCPR